MTGSLGDIFCDNPSVFVRPVIVAGCGLCDVATECCKVCCKEGEACNDGVFVPDLDPIWQLGYKRVFYTFERDEYFTKERLNITGEDF